MIYMYYYIAAAWECGHSRLVHALQRAVRCFALSVSLSLCTRMLSITCKFLSTHVCLSVCPLQIEECLVCSEMDANVLFRPCLHMVACDGALLVVSICSLCCTLYICSVMCVILQYLVVLRVSLVF